MTIRLLENKENDLDENDVSILIVASIAVFLIVLTMSFEVVKQFLEHKCDKIMMPILNRVFAEMTVLGFISLFTYLIDKMGVFRYLAMIVFDDENEEELMKVFESVDIVLFLIMILFIIQALIFVQAAKQLGSQWGQIDEVFRKRIRKETVLKNSRKSMRRSVAGFKPINFDTVKFRDLLPFMRNIEDALSHDIYYFRLLRTEFLVERSMDYPFYAMPPHRRLDSEFNFGRYLSLCLAETLASTVDVKKGPWIFLIFVTIFYCCFSFIVDENIQILAWSWVLIGWAVLFFNIYFERHLLWLRKKLVPRIFDKIEQEEAENKNELKMSLSAMSDSDSDMMPEWTDVSLDEYFKSRSKLVSWINRRKGSPNHLQTLYWFDTAGPEIYSFIMQINLLFSGIYWSIIFLAFLPYMKNEEGKATYTAYLILVSIPGVYNIINKKQLISALAQVCSVGMYRKPKWIGQVLREMKTGKAVRSFLIIESMKSFAASVHSRTKKTSFNVHYTELLDVEETVELDIIFDSLDDDKDGTVDLDELALLMDKLGAPLTKTSLHNLMNILDADGDGRVTKREFYQWYAENSRQTNSNVKERAQRLFDMFDEDRSGDVSIEEFKAKLDVIRPDFTIDEVVAIVNELDEDGRGSIGLTEFEKMIIKYSPRNVEDDANSTYYTHHILELV